MKSRKNRRIECKICQAMLTPMSMKEHIRDYHAVGRKFSCSKCLMTFKAKKDVRRHEKVHLKKFKCKKCPKKFRLQYDLNKHIEQFHENPRRFECDYCGMKFYEKVVIKRHVWLHAGIPKVKYLKCQKCDFASADKQQFTKHLTCHQRIDSFWKSVNNKLECRICSQVFGNFVFFSRHYKCKHRVYSCDYCDKKYKAVAYLINHVKKCCRLAKGFGGSKQKGSANK
ncbi:hypothetical protein ACKWTF_015303 [Chironomus riparius]